jgi:hypothetical protein
MIPFKYGTVVSGKDFCGRRALIQQLSDLIASSQNVLVQGERRIGKTSLIYETLRKLKGFRPLSVDVMGIKTSHDFCQRTIKAIISLEAKGSFLTKLLQHLASLRPQLGIDPVTGLPTVSLDQSIRLSPESLEEIFDIIDELDKRKHLVVVFDEFQDVLKTSDSDTTLAVLRSKIQHHNKIPYVFAGSVRNEMDGIFTGPDSPLFKSAIPITVGPIEDREFSRFLKKKFLSSNRTVEDSVLKKLFAITDNVTGDVQQLCEALWSVTSDGDVIAGKNLSKAFRLIFARESKSYEHILGELTATQIRCLRGLAQTDGREPTSSHFLAITGIRQPSTVTRALLRLQNLNVIFKMKNEYRFVNPFFKAWINSEILL